MNAETHSPTPIGIIRITPDGIKVADAEDVAEADADLGIELVIGDW
jgi:hypothetical protein